MHYIQGIPFSVILFGFEHDVMENSFVNLTTVVSLFTM